jgi:single-stranded-DNA-specific exonuclease
LNEAFLKQKTVGEDRSAAGGDELFVDTELSLGDVNWDTYRKIEQLAPFGTGNPKPLFIFRNIRPVGVKKFGKEGGHLELDFGGVGGGNSGGIKAIGFFMTPESWAETLGRELRAGESLSLVATFEKSMFRGRTELRLRIVDIL